MFKQSMGSTFNATMNNTPHHFSSPETWTFATKELGAFRGKGRKKETSQESIIATIILPFFGSMQKYT